MNLTEEERVVADDIARHWSCILDSVDDAWARALAYIAARREALGQMRTVPGEVDLSRDATPGHVYFSHRRRMAKAASEWCRAGKWSETALNIVTALGCLGMLRSDEPATDAGVGAPAAEAGSENILAWYVEGGKAHTFRAWLFRSHADEVAKTWGGTVVPLVRQGSQGVRVTGWQCEAVRVAAELVRGLGHNLVARELDHLIAAIDAAKGGAT